MRKCPSFQECHVKSGIDDYCDWFSRGYCVFPHPALESLSEETGFSECSCGYEERATKDDKKCLFCGV
jgi:hypothetical protein